MKILFDDILLARGTTACEQPTDLRIVSQKEAQVSTLIGASNAQVLDRGNSTTAVSFGIERVHKNPELAERFCLEHIQRLSKQSGVLSFLFESATANTSAFSLTNACIIKIESHAQGIRSYHKYNIIGEKLDNSK